MKVGDRVSEGRVVLMLEAARPAPRKRRRREAAARAREGSSGASAGARGRRGGAAPPARRRLPLRPAAQGGAAGRRAIEVKVPAIGDFKDVPVIEVLVKAGDAVKADDPLVTLESEKATMDVPVAGGWHGPRGEGEGRRPGERGQPCSFLDAAGGARRAGAGPSARTAPAAAAPAAAGARRAPAHARRRQPAPAPAPAARRGEPRSAVPHASPSVRKLARELGVDLARVRAPGRAAGSCSEDVQRLREGGHDRRRRAGAAAAAAGSTSRRGRRSTSRSSARSRRSRSRASRRSPARTWRGTG